MRKTILIAGLLLIFSFQFPIFNSVQAQRIHAFLSSGVALSQIEGDELKGFRKAGYVGGVGALTALDEHNRWGLSLEALFCQRGAYNITSEPYAADIALNYIDIPLLFHYQDAIGGMLFGAGITYGRLVGQPHFRGLVKDTFLPDTADFAFLYNDFAAVLDARFTIWRGLQFNIRWQYSFIPVKRNWHFAEFRQNRWERWENNCYNNSLIFRLIYQF